MAEKSYPTNNPAGSYPTAPPPYTPTPQDPQMPPVQYQQPPAYNYPQPVYYQQAPSTYYPLAQSVPYNPYPVPPVQGDPSNTVIAVGNAFDAYAKIGPGQSIPPPPPGCLPNSAQQYAAMGYNVQIGQKKRSFWW